MRFERSVSSDMSKNYQVFISNVTYVLVLFQITNIEKTINLYMKIKAYMFCTKSNV